VRSNRREAGILLLVTLVVGLAGCAGGGPECAPYARERTGLQLHGDAASWWREAAGRYPRTATPVPGSVLVFRRSARLPDGHVAVVERLLDGRLILVDHANWVSGRISRDAPVADVSPGNDWTVVRVWWDPIGGFGRSIYPTFGFITPGHVQAAGAPDAAAAE